MLLDYGFFLLTATAAIRDINPEANYIYLSSKMAAIASIQAEMDQRMALLK